MTRFLRVLRRFVLGPLVLLLVAASLLPLVETNIWWIRYLDFPRVQFAVALLAASALYVICGGWRGFGSWLLLAVAAGGLAYHGVKLYPYGDYAEPMAVTAQSCPQGARLRLMEANVKAGNEHAAAFLDEVREAKPDVLLVLETDEWWDRHLRELQDFPFRRQYIPDGPGWYGMHVLSRYRLQDPQMQFLFDSRTPTLRTGIELPDGDTVTFFGVHPKPPQSWSQSTTLRDGHLATIAREARDAEGPVLVSGDFNAVPWERVVRRMMRVGGLLDPRVGRGWHPTYGDGPLVTWPLDQVLFQDGIALRDLQVLDDVGSDHYPLIADLCVDASFAERQNAPQPRDGDAEEFSKTIAAAKEIDPGGSR